MERNETYSKLKNTYLKGVFYLITDAWTLVKQSVIIKGWKHFFNIVDGLEFDLAADYVNEDEDNFPIIKLYRNVMPNISVDESELLSWSKGIAENSRQLNIKADESLKDTSEEVVADIRNIFDIDAIIHGLTRTID